MINLLPSLNGLYCLTIYLHAMGCQSRLLVAIPYTDGKKI